MTDRRVTCRWSIATGCNMLVMYNGAIPLNDLYTRTQSLNSRHIKNNILLLLLAFSAVAVVKQQAFGFLHLFALHKSWSAAHLSLDLHVSCCSLVTEHVKAFLPLVTLPSFLLLCLLIILHDVAVVPIIYTSHYSCRNKLADTTWGASSTTSTHQLWPFVTKSQNTADQFGRDPVILFSLTPTPLLHTSVNVANSIPWTTQSAYFISVCI